MRAMIRDPESMTSEEIRWMQLDVAARIADARRRAIGVVEHDRAVREIRRLLPLQQEIQEWE